MTIKVKNLRKKFDGLEVLKDVNFEVNKGEIVSIEGKSGEGKTTILRCINGLEEADGGVINISGEYLCRDVDGRNVYANNGTMDKIRTKIGLVFQNYNLFPHMTVEENLRLSPESRNLYDNGDLEKRMNALIRDLDLKGKEKLYPSQLSGGQQQRVAIARACMLEPDVLCFDEPTSALDEETRDQIQVILEELKEKMAIIVVTHDKEFSENISNRILRISNGVLEEEIIKAV